MSPEISSLSPGNVATDTIPLRSTDHLAIQSAIIRAADDLPANELTMREFYVVSSVADHDLMIRKHLIGGTTPETTELYFAYSPFARHTGEQSHPNDFMLRFSGKDPRSNQEINSAGGNVYWQKPLFDASKDKSWNQSGEVSIDETHVKLIVGALTGYRAYPEELASNRDTHPLSVMIATAKDLARTANKAAMFDTVTSLMEIPGTLTTICLSALEQQRKVIGNKPMVTYELQVSNHIDTTDKIYPRVGIRTTYNFSRSGLSPDPSQKSAKIKSKHPSWPGTLTISAQVAENDFGPKPSPKDTVKILQSERRRYLLSPQLLPELVETALHHLEVPNT